MQNEPAHVVLWMVMNYNVFSGIFRDEPNEHKQKAAVHHLFHYAFVGSSENVKKDLQSFVASTGVNELMITSHLFHLEDKINCYCIISSYFKKPLHVA